jgi:succinoglycan biosynthesis transport protein ExoP
MPATQQSEFVNSQTDIPVDEIELIDLLKVIWKWKYLIFGGTIVFALAAAIISFTLPKIYSVDTIIEPGLLTIVNEGGGQDRRIYIDSPQNIKALIDVGSFENQISEGLGELPKATESPKHIHFKASIPKQSNALKITYETSNVEEGNRILNYLTNLLIEKYNPIIEHYKNDFDGKIQVQAKMISDLAYQISKVNNDISNLQIDSGSFTKQKSNEILSIKAKQESKKWQIKNLQNGISDSQTEIGRVDKNTDLLIMERNKLLASETNPNNTLSSVIYINTIQQNISYISELKNRVNSVNQQIFQEMSGIENLESQIQDLNIQMEGQKKQTGFKIENLESQIKNLENQLKYRSGEIKSIETKKNSVQNIQILKSPMSSPDPIKPKKKRNVLLAALIGIFMMVCLSFFLEYISKNKVQKLSPD